MVLLARIADNLANLPNLEEYKIATASTPLKKSKLITNITRFDFIKYNFYSYYRLIQSEIPY